jgi:hypothetical protein
MAHEKQKAPQAMKSLEATQGVGGGGQHYAFVSVEGQATVPVAALPFARTK